jgi:hypothetical protein
VDKQSKDTIWESLKEIENASQAIEMWIFTHKKEVDQKRLETYELLAKIATLKEDAKFEPRPSKRNPDDDKPFRHNSTGGKLRGSSEQDYY